MRPTSSIRIREAIDTVRAATVVAPLADTIDTVKSGDPDRSLTGIITTSQRPAQSSPAQRILV